MQVLDRCSSMCCLCLSTTRCFRAALIVLDLLTFCLFPNWAAKAPTSVWSDVCLCPFQSSQYVQCVAGCLQLMLKVNEYRFSWVEADGVNWWVKTHELYLCYLKIYIYLFGFGIEMLNKTSWVLQWQGHIFTLMWNVCILFWTHLNGEGNWNKHNFLIQMLNVKVFAVPVSFLVSYLLCKTGPTT